MSPGYSRPPHHDYVDRTDLRAGKEGDIKMDTREDIRGDNMGHVINTGALYRQPLLNGQGEKVGQALRYRLLNKNWRKYKMAHSYVLYEEIKEGLTFC